MVSELSRELLDTEAKIAELEAMPKGALVEHLLSVFRESLRNKALCLIAPGVRSELAGC
jgi:hypothetical protein